ncbi:hypothetical protein BD626DRAFT_569446 [Schizophyllum amplum]|uniref:Uncharacterized protein n=1 Tax=Schizophyllum amplum TaxID=97359 RepID=A0A550CDJ9_9AGAR|nr:hypothetical protein BD626DRAFT_569444 [Auriculariopsis ampla]TRM62859.1 hypothetical protein BD626DRAFT_569446 [Auriculariopsis ampla]
MNVPTMQILLSTFDLPSAGVLDLTRSPLQCALILDLLSMILAFGRDISYHRGPAIAPTVTSGPSSRIVIQSLRCKPADFVVDRDTRHVPRRASRSSAHAATPHLLPPSDGLACPALMAGSHGAATRGSRAWHAHEHRCHAASPLSATTPGPRARCLRQRADAAGLTSRARASSLRLLRTAGVVKLLRTTGWPGRHAGPAPAASRRRGGRVSGRERVARVVMAVLPNVEPSHVVCNGERRRTVQRSSALFTVGSCGAVFARSLLVTFSGRRVTQHRGSLRLDFPGETPPPLYGAMLGTVHESG